MNVERRCSPCGLRNIVRVPLRPARLSRLPGCAALHVSSYPSLRFESFAMTDFSATELLAPAGGRSQLEAAVRFGADAVYLAADKFGMRQRAENLHA